MQSNRYFENQCELGMHTLNYAKFGYYSFANNSFGLNEKVFVYFWTGKNNRIISKDPNGKIIFPDTKVITGIPYYVNVYHPFDISTRTTKRHCIAKIETIATPTSTDPDLIEPIIDMWISFFEDWRTHQINKIKAFRKYQRNFNQEDGLRFCKDYIDTLTGIIMSKTSFPELKDFAQTLKGNSTAQQNNIKSYLQSNTNNQNGRIRILNQEIEKLKIALWNSKKAADTAQYSLERYRETIQDLAEKYKKEVLKNQSTTDVNVWDIIQCSSSDDKEKIRKEVDKAIKQYHPDVVSRSGDIIINLATEITQKLLVFRKQIK